MKSYIWPLLAVTILLAGCVSRDQADSKLAKGCEAGAKAFLADNIKVKEVKQKTFRDSAEFGTGYRTVILNVIESDGWYEPDKQYKCVFAEEFGPFGMSYSASIYQLKINDQTYGKDGDKIIGDLNDHMKLKEAVDRGMGL